VNGLLWKASGRSAQPAKRPVLADYCPMRTAKIGTMCPLVDIIIFESAKPMRRKFPRFTDAS
jgi:hypothetical protein